MRFSEPYTVFCNIVSMNIYYADHLFKKTRHVLPSSYFLLILYIGPDSRVKGRWGGIFRLERSMYQIVRRANETWAKSLTREERRKFSLMKSLAHREWCCPAQWGGTFFYQNILHSTSRFSGVQVVYFEHVPAPSPLIRS